MFIRGNVIVFSGEDQQNPVAWLRDYNAAAEANGWNNTRKLQVVSAYLRSTAAEWYQSLKQDNPGLITTWVAGMNGNVNNFEDRFLKRFRKRLFTRVGGYNEALKTRKFISGLTRDLYIMVQSTHVQNAIDRAKRCEMTLLAGRNKNTSNHSGNTQLETTQLAQMMMELSKDIS